MPDQALDHLGDDELLARARAGDPAAFEALYRRHRAFVFRTARRFAGDDQTALDAAQETFIYLARALPRVRLSGKLTTLLYPVARNCALTQRRKRGRGHAADLPESLAPALPVPAAPNDHAALYAAVDGLPEGQREVLLLRVVDGLSVDEVAAALGIPPGTVKSRLFHALAALRASEELRSYWDVP